jgi:phosphate starvation-inducible PhoH-like protein
MDTTKAKKLQIKFENNNDLLQVCGANDSHLQFLEKRLNVQLFPKGNIISILGQTDDTFVAYNTLFSLLELCHTGLNIDAEHLKMAFKIENGKRKKSKDDKKEYNIENGGLNLKNSDFIFTPKQRITPRSDSQKAYIKNLKNKTITFATGPAGTGKTFLATALAVEKLMNKEISKIIITRPVVEAGENLGFLPGTLEEKIDPFLRPFFDAINYMIGAEKAQQLIEQGIIEVAPLAYMRGRTIRDSFMLLDEAQNTTKMQMKMFLTRLGENSQAAITGDITQIDLPKNEESGLLDAVGRLNGIKDISINKFNHTDVVRHKLVAQIIQAYDKK